MQNATFNKETLAFNKSAVTAGFDALSTFNTQAEVVTEHVLKALPTVPEESKKAASLYFKAGQNGLNSLQQYLESSLELDWSTKDAPVKSLEALEAFYKNAASTTIDLKKETTVLIEKTTKQLPKEVKSLIDTWNDSFNSGFEQFQSYITTSFDVAKKVAGNSFVVTPLAQPKAAK